ncbi:carboxylate--amine ligase [Planomonospora parontospora subsp. parontospora]|uniref:Carboxylate--amine ligase n=2 Tax=Planomonospora parontospora TaxID=58119 RepID=A0AA37F4V6_9ACTN|nr:siderophore biosynthesis protein [Planomonospora parontospora]GGK69330.1 carboxylate--amine ligase [Planomonospora parontospora]GII08923.1 carboxylate--amine ligase [Planomonospora parontospora subsp. parontospora]
MRLYLTALKPTDSVTDGFLPAARALGCDVTVLTDRPEQYTASGAEALACDVRDARAVIDVIAHHHPPAAVFSNSDHIQAETALAAAYFDLPGKDWRACVAAKNKALTRRRLAAAGVETVRSVRLAPDDPVPAGDVPLPAVVKPSQGVASEDVVLVRDGRELAGAVRAIRGRRPGETLVVEEYLDGPLHTLETLGDGRAVRVLGGFRTTLGPLPHFVEERLDWEPPPAAGHVLRALRALGVGFGACHTEYVMTADGPRIIEVNYRVIGDHCDFLLADLLGVPLFERILGVHLGLGLGPDLERAAVHGTALSLVAERSGTVTRAPGIVAPSPGDRVRLWHRPLRSVGDRIDRSHTNRDYLGIVRAVGPDRASVDEAVSAFTAADPWVIA